MGVCVAHCELGFAEREVPVTEAGGEGPRKRLGGPVRRAEASRKGYGACVSGRVVTVPPPSSAEPSKRKEAKWIGREECPGREITISESLMAADKGFGRRWKGRG